MQALTMFVRTSNRRGRLALGNRRTPSLCDSPPVVSLVTPLIDIRGVTKGRMFQGDVVRRHNRHWRAVVPNVAARRTAFRSTEMKGTIGEMKPLVVVELRPADEDCEVEFNWLSIVID